MPPGLAFSWPLISNASQLALAEQAAAHCSRVAELPCKLMPIARASPSPGWSAAFHRSAPRSTESRQQPFPMTLVSGKESPRSESVAFIAKPPHLPFGEQMCEV